MTVKKKIGRPKKVTTLDGRMELFLRALSEAYPNDPTTPGLVVSWLKRNGNFYVSIKRYNERYGEGGYVVLARQAATLSGALKGTANAWLDLMNPEKSALKVIQKSGF